MELLQSFTKPVICHVMLQWYIFLWTGYHRNETFDVWHQTGNKPFSESIRTQYNMYIGVITHHWHIYRLVQEKRNSSALAIVIYVFLARTQWNYVLMNDPILWHRSGLTSAQVMACHGLPFFQASRIWSWQNIPVCPVGKSSSGQCLAFDTNQDRLQGICPHKSIQSFKSFRVWRGPPSKLMFHWKIALEVVCLPWSQGEISSYGELDYAWLCILHLDRMDHIRMIISFTPEICCRDFISVICNIFLWLVS